MLSDDQIYRRLLDAVAQLEQVDAWPPAAELAHAFAEALDGVA